MGPETSRSPEQSCDPRGSWLRDGYISSSLARLHLVRPSLIAAAVRCHGSLHSDWLPTAGGEGGGLCGETDQTEEKFPRLSPPSLSLTCIPPRGERRYNFSKIHSLKSTSSFTDTIINGSYITCIMTIH